MQVPFNESSTVGNEAEYLRQVITSKHLSGDGTFTKQCCAFIENATQGHKALLTHSCTAALEMAAILCDLRLGDEVIMPSFTFVSTANAVVLRGAVPVFVDIDTETLNLNATLVERAITPKTRAIFAVHYAGIPADMSALRIIADQHNLLLVEDAAQAFGSKYKGRPAGSLGDIATFSFHETKNILSGEGGALVVNRPQLIERAEIIRDKGTNRSRFFRGEVDKYTWVDIGSSFLPSEIVAAYLLAQLEMAETVNAKRLEYFQHYKEAFTPFAETGRVTLPDNPLQCEGNGHIFYLIMRDSKDRSAFIDHMDQASIQTPFHYVPLHNAPAGRVFGRAVGNLEVTVRIADSLVRLPLYYTLGDRIDEVIEAASNFLRKSP